MGGRLLGSSHSGAMTGHCAAGAVKRLFGCAAFSFEAGVHGLPCQSTRRRGAGPSMPSHHTPPSSVMATLVKIEFRLTASMAFGLVLRLVPGATPK